jgi:hypothetical protein
MNSDGSGVRKVADLGLGLEHPVYGYSITWLPGGKDILFNNNLINVDSGEITELNFGFDTSYATWFIPPDEAGGVPIPTPNCAAGWSRLYPGSYVAVTGGQDDPPNRIRSAPDASAEIIAQIYPGDIVYIRERWF